MKLFFSLILSVFVCQGFSQTIASPNEKLSLSFTLTSEGQPLAKKGVMDLRSWDFNQNKLALNGYWNFYKNELVSPSGIAKKTGQLAHFPDAWDETIQYATYHLLVIMPSTDEKFALELPHFNSSYELWVNGKKIAENGRTGKTRESTAPKWMPQNVAFDNANDTLSILVQISNFYLSQGGSNKPIYLGKAGVMQHRHHMSVKSNLAEALGLTILGLSFFAVYYVRQERKKITLYFALLCLTWAIRTVCSNMYVINSYIPDLDWALLVRIEYITFFLTMIWAILFLGRLFPNENKTIIRYLFVVVNCTSIALTIVSSPLFFTQWLNVYLAIAGLLLLFSMIIVIRAWINERSGARYVVVCAFLGIAMFCYDMFVHESFFYHSALIFSVGYLVLFLMMGISLLYHLQIFTGDGSSGTLTYEDLYGKINN